MSTRVRNVLHQERIEEANRAKWRVNFDDETTSIGAVVDGRVLACEQLTSVGCSIMTATVGTNGFHGGDGGHGSRTYLRFVEEGCGTFTIRHDPRSNTLDIVGYGDDELATLVKVLRFAADTLEAQSTRGDLR
ncbi:hypothetical protein FRC0360_00740 [Corynebacterium diphtheriae]|nr:hypothetical protein FRC0360_00740 [Corynebacterium diphtheriae]